MYYIRTLPEAVAISRKDEEYTPFLHY